MAKKNPRIGSSFDDFLGEDGILEEVEARARKRVLARQLEQMMKEQHLTKAQLARRMGTSRSSLDRLLDPANASVTLHTMTAAAHALGTRLDISLAQRPSRTVRTRERLRVGPGDRLRYVIDAEGVHLEKGTSPADDDPFATFVEWAGEEDDAAYADL